VITSVQDWISFLRDSHSAVGFPLIVGGMTLTLFGWRLWKVAVILAFGVIGMMIGAYLSGPRDDQVYYALASGVFLGAASYWPLKYSVSVLGGVLGGCVAYYYLESWGAPPLVLWGLTGLVTVTGTGFAMIHRRHVVILVTAFLGAILITSGLMTWVMTMPVLFSTYRSMAAWSIIVVPFLVLVPTVMSCFYQLAEIYRLQVEL